MFREIVELAQSSNYDFRESACPDDRLSYLFEEWVPYYRGKWAIARYLQPARILEIGVRYGYSALAFLNAWPWAAYTGIDLDSDRYGGVKGAIEWARHQAREYEAEFLVADSQSFDRFPGGRFDLIHIDGQQDQAGFLHDMEIAMTQAKYILVDGYFWTRDNFLSASEFLFRNKDLIEYYGVIPGYAGDLLIATKELQASEKARSSEHLREEYTSHYYLRDCGGHDSFKRTQGARLVDPRLLAVSQIASLAPPGRALDLGCGRGELSIALAGAGYDVTAVDYSPEAIALAESAARAAGPSLHIDYVCDDVVAAPLQGCYQAVVAADVVEHLAPSELDKLYEKVAAHLSPDGLFVVHTFPNAWFYRYEHARRLRVAKSVGAYLPADPRSRFERLMHINEQSPRVLRRQLQRYFPHVLLWFSDHEIAEPVANLERRFTIREMAQAGDLFVVASKRPIQPAAIVTQFRMQPAAIAQGAVALEVLQAPSSARAESTFPIELLISNRSETSLKCYPPNPVNLAYHWLEADSGEMVVFDGERTPLEPPLMRQGVRSYQMLVRTPPQPGNYLLRATLVQENVQWFDAPAISAFADLSIVVT